MDPITFLVLGGIGYFFFKMHQHKKTSDDVAAKTVMANPPPVPDHVKVLGSVPDDPSMPSYASGVSSAQAATGNVGISSEMKSQVAASEKAGYAPVGSHENPFQLSGSLYGPKDAWATRVVNGVREYGQFSVPVGILGKTQYKYQKVG